ncbi:hypothetical protein HZA97_06155 [Candidatus Woesearchaeota archaeon]|nr:hypothetical protein [Candidatus Woesearchaeota archaeon]
MKKLLSLIGAGIISLCSCDLNTQNNNPNNNPNSNPNIQVVERIVQKPVDVSHVTIDNVLASENSLMMFSISNFRNTEMNVPINSSDYLRFKVQSHRIQNDSDMLNFVTYNHPQIKNIAEYLKNNFTEDPAETILEFVHKIVYNSTIESDREYVRYPIETLVERNGDCEDLTILAAALMKSIDIDVALVHIPGGIIDGKNVTGHMPLGVAGNYTGNYYEAEGKKYFYAETTGTHWAGRPSSWTIGQIPEEMKLRKARIFVVR